MSLLPLHDYQRYGRQMILDGIGLPGQLGIQSASVVVVGAGGLGCPALQYLAAAGVGKIGIVDHDRVELSNLQRQILHTEETIGMFKAESAAVALKRIKSTLNIIVFTVLLDQSNALDLLHTYDIILDCTDNVATRYLLSDAAVTLGKPLVSGAAQKFEGQLCVFNLGPSGPCYRCLYPTPPPQETVGSCAELGILGVVTGTIGNLQALETIKIILGLQDLRPSLLLFDALGRPPFRSIKLRSKQPTCKACSNPTESLKDMYNTDYVRFCGGPAPDWVTQGLVVERGSNLRASVKELYEIFSSGKEPTILDVRSPTEFGICHLPGSTNVPLKKILSDPKAYVTESSHDGLYIVCRLGNDSQIAAESLRRASSNLIVKDVIGGLRAWSSQVDPQFPIY